MTTRKFFHCIQLTILAAILAVSAGCGSDSPTAPAATSASAGKSVDLDGNTSRVTIESSRDTYDFVHATGEFTIEAWVKMDDPDDEQFFAITGNTFTNGDYGFFFGLENRGGQHQLRMNISAGRNIIDARSAANAITDDEWHHVAVTGDGDEVSFFVDGVEISEAGGMSGFGNAPATRDLHIGDIYSSGPDQWQWDGELDEVRIWEVEKEEPHFEKLMRTRLRKKYYQDDSEKLVGYWRFDELENLNAGKSGENDIRDLSVSNRHGDLSDGAELVKSEAF